MQARQRVGLTRWVAPCLTVKGPARIIVSVDGVKVEAGKAVEVSRETCGSVEASAHQGGLVARGVSYKK